MTTELVLLRRKHALTQAELAGLLGVVQTTVSRLEQSTDYDVRNIRLDMAFALQVIFGRRPAQLFAHLFDEVEDAVMMRAAALDRSLDGCDDRMSEHKRALLSDMARRSGRNRPTS
jgi:transcriptional regulator with XRE-family HTH domain